MANSRKNQLTNKLTLGTAILSVLVGSVTTSLPVLASSPLRLEYLVKDIGGGLFSYDFTLSVDNNDGSYIPGQQWGWIIFGDAPFPGPSPLTDWVGDLSNSSPLIASFSSSGGGNNGPTLYLYGPAITGVLNPWTPSGIGDSLIWSGTSTANLSQDELLFSTLNPQGEISAISHPGNRANFQMAFRQPVPEPSFILGFLAFGALGAFSTIKRKQKPTQSMEAELEKSPQNHL